jgi:hypothetical protein
LFSAAVTETVKKPCREKKMVFMADQIPSNLPIPPVKV